MKSIIIVLIMFNILIPKMCIRNNLDLTKCLSSLSFISLKKIALVLLKKWSYESFVTPLFLNIKLFWGHTIYLFFFHQMHMYSLTLSSGINSVRLIINCFFFLANDKINNNFLFTNSNFRRFVCVVILTNYRRMVVTDNENISVRCQIM